MRFEQQAEGQKACRFACGAGPRQRAQPPVFVEGTRGVRKFSGIAQRRQQLLFLDEEMRLQFAREYFCQLRGKRASTSAW